MMVKMLKRILMEAVREPASDYVAGGFGVWNGVGGAGDLDRDPSCITVH